jgi:hypothetical protein
LKESKAKTKAAALVPVSPGSRRIKLKLNHSEEAEVFVFPASFAQQRMWFLDRLFPGNPFYNVCAALRLTGSLNASALEQTFNEMVCCH